jgi:hypothetical protein
MRPIFLIQADAITLRGIVTLLEGTPATTQEIVATQYVSVEVARRLCEKLLQAGIITRPAGQAEWELSEAYFRGEVALDAEKLARVPITMHGDHSLDELKRVEMGRF